VAWQSNTSTNYFRFSFAIDSGYVAELSGVQFDYLSQKTGVSGSGPTQYDILVSINGAAFRTISGGWNAMSADGAWHQGVLASNGGVSVSNLSGYVTIALAAKNAATQASSWNVDNIIVLGQVRPGAPLPSPPRLTSLIPHSQVRFSGVTAGQFYSVQYAADLVSAWKWQPGAANLTSAGPELVADIHGLDGPSIFVRGVTSFGRLPAVDLEGY
jgi:hypothetical protein